MSPFEDQLRSALQRKEAPAGFAARVLARVPSRKLFGPRLRWAAVMALGILLIAGGIEYRERQAEAEAERATEQVLTALRITAEKLRIVDAKLEELSR